MNAGRFRHHKYTWSKPFSHTRHVWEVIGPNGAIHFHASVKDLQDPSPGCGLEFHHLSGDGAPHHIDRPLTGGRCWHDGTSLYASEILWPEIIEYLKRGEHEHVFRILEHEYEKHFFPYDREV
jgi:hypothetical protein